MLKKAAAHQGSAFVEILQNCNIFNDGAWETLTEKDLRDEHTIALEHGKPLVFGKAKDKGIRMNGLALEVVTLGNGVTEKDLIVHDERDPNPAYAFLLSRMDATPGFPTPIGVLRAVDAPRYETLIAEQVRAVTAKKGKGDLGRAAARGRHLGRCGYERTLRQFSPLTARGSRTIFGRRESEPPYHCGGEARRDAISRCAAERRSRTGRDRQSPPAELPGARRWEPRARRRATAGPKGPLITA